MTNLQAIIIATSVVAAAGVHGYLTGGRYAPVGQAVMLDTLTGNMRTAGRDTLRADMQKIRDQIAEREKADLIAQTCPPERQSGEGCMTGFGMIEKKRLRQAPSERLEAPAF